jgi:hypothetical protein
MVTGTLRLICTPGLAPCDDSDCDTCRPLRPFRDLHPNLTPTPTLTNDLLHWRESAQEVPCTFSASSTPIPSVRSEDQSFGTKRRPRKRRSSGRQAEGNRVRTKLNDEVKTRIMARIPCVWFQGISGARDKDVLLAAMRYLCSLRDRISGDRTVPASRVEVWPLGRLWNALQAMIPEHLTKEAKAAAKARVKYTGSIHIMIAVGLYLDELEAAVSGLEGNAVQSSGLDEAQEWYGLSDSEGAGEIALHPELGEEGKWNGVSERDGAVKDATPSNQLTEEEWNGIVGGIEEQSRNIKALEEVLTRAEGSCLCIGNLAHTATEADLDEFFSGYEVESITLHPQKGTIRWSYRYGFLDLKKADEAGSTISELAGEELLGPTITIELVAGPGSRKKREAMTEAGGDDGPQDNGEGTSASDKTHRVSQAEVENALRKMEQWCDLWLGGKIEADQWHTFQDCLGLF